MSSVPTQDCRVATAELTNTDSTRVQFEGFACVKRDELLALVQNGGTVKYSFAAIVDCDDAQRDGPYNRNQVRHGAREENGLPDRLIILRVSGTCFQETILADVNAIFGLCHFHNGVAHLFGSQYGSQVR